MWAAYVFVLIGLGVQNAKSLVIRFRPGILSGRDDVLADDDDREQHQLEERLAQPGNACHCVALRERSPRLR